MLSTATDRELRRGNFRLQNMSSQVQHPDIPITVPYIVGNEWNYIKTCLDTGWVSSVGSFVDRFESEVAQYVGVPYGVAVASGTASLHIALLLSNVSATDEVLAPTLSFVAPINAICYLGAKPVFMDCDEYLNIDPVKVKEFCEQRCHFNGTKLINKKTGAAIKAIIVVHTFGHPAKLDLIQQLAVQYRFKIIEDAAESIGSYYTLGESQKKQTGSIGDFGCFSFNGNKIITSGSGGMLVVHSREAMERARWMTTQARNDTERFIHNDIGYNYRLSNLHAAMGCAQLEQLNHLISLRHLNLKRYKEHLHDVEGVQLIDEPDYASSNYWLYTIRIDENIFGTSAFKLKRALDKERIQTRLIWHLNHLQKPFCRFENYNIINATRLQSMTLNLPSYAKLTENEIERICDAIREVGKAR